MSVVFNEEGDSGYYPTVEEHYIGIFEYSHVRNKWEDVSRCLDGNHKERLFDCITHRGVLHFDPLTGRLQGLGIDHHFSITVTDNEGDLELGKVSNLQHNTHYVMKTRGDFSLQMFDSDLYSIGGSDIQSLCEIFSTNEVHKYNFTSDSWTKVACMNEKRAKCSSIQLSK